jgi:hypothetical protein
MFNIKEQLSRVCTTGATVHHCEVSTTGATVHYCEVSINFSVVNFVLINFMEGLHYSHHGSNIKITSTSRSRLQALPGKYNEMSTKQTLFGPEHCLRNKTFVVMQTL